MKIALIAMLITSANFAVAMDESTYANTPKTRKVAQQPPATVEPAVKPNQPEPPAGTIVKPTEEQLKTIPKTVPKKKTEEVSSDTTEAKPVEETQVTVTEEKSSSDASPHLFGFHADLNVPHLVSYGLDYWHSARWFSASANMGGANIPSSTLKSMIKDVDDPSVKISHMEAVARLHVFAGSFYVGLAYGSHTIEGAGNKTVTITAPAPGSATIRITDKIQSNYLTPHIGWLWKLDMGLTFGFDLGWLAPANASVDLKEQALTPLPGSTTLADFQATPEYQQARKDIVDGSEQAGKKGIPYVALFRIGYMF